MTEAPRTIRACTSTAAAPTPRSSATSSGGRRSAPTSAVTSPATPAPRLLPARRSRVRATHRAAAGIASTKLMPFPLSMALTKTIQGIISRSDVCDISGIGHGEGQAHFRPCLKPQSRWHLRLTCCPGPLSHVKPRRSPYDVNVYKRMCVCVCSMTALCPHMCMCVHLHAAALLINGGTGDNVCCNHMYLSVRAHVHVCVQVLIHTRKCTLSLRPSLGLRLIVSNLPTLPCNCTTPCPAL